MMTNFYFVSYLLSINVIYTLWSDIVDFGKNWRVKLFCFIKSGLKFSFFVLFEDVFVAFMFLIRIKSPQ